MARTYLGRFLFTGDDVEEKTDASVHHVTASIYALDYQKKSALTGTYHREPSGGFAGNNLGYDMGYTYVHPKLGFVGYGHVTLQQTSISSTRSSPRRPGRFPESISSTCR